MSDLTGVRKKCPKHLGGHGNRTHVDRGALSWARKRLEAKSLVDLGCGPGGVVEDALALGYEKVLGIDGDPTISYREGFPIVRHDFSVGGLKLEDSYDLLWTVEFLEHVDEKFIDNFFQVMSSARYVACTHALPGKNGHHHVNCQSEDYWKGEFSSRGFMFCGDLTEELRKASTMKREFMRQTGKVFKRVKATGQQL